MLEDHHDGHEEEAIDLAGETGCALHVVHVSSGEGVALIAVDGKPAKAYAVGSRLDGELVLQAVSLRTASIGTAQGAMAVTLELPPLPPPATGTLPLAGTPIPQLTAAPVAPMPPAALPEMQIPPSALPVPPVPRASSLVPRPREPGSATTQ